MSAIAGWASARACPDPADVAAMAQALSHRTHGESLSAVIDRSPRRSIVLAASLTDAASRISLSLDGAILNAAALRAELGRRGFSFKSDAQAADSQAELLLRAYQYWDKEVVKQLRGPLAFALWDARKERLILARDRFGQKPLYLHEAAGTLYFASEAKALLRSRGVTAEVDVGAVGEYLAAGYVRGPRTLLRGVRKLPPASYAIWQFGNLREVRYWNVPDGESAAHKRPGGDPVEGFIERLDEAVRISLPASSAVGMLLSGGYDSAAIIALMKRHRDRIATFSAGLADDKRSELGAAAKLARHFAAEHHELVLRPRDILAHLPELVASRDAPFCRPSEIALHLLAREAARSVRVALSGDGSDEVLGGYRRHTFLRGFAPKPARPGGLFVIPVASPRDGDDPVADARASALRRILYYEQVGRLPDNLLERAERMTTAASLELRAPFVDHRLAEYVSSLPDALRVRGLTTKRILRQADRRLLAEAAVKPRKAGFRIRLDDLLRGEMRDLVDLLRGPACLTRAYYDAATLERLIDEHLAVRKNHEEILWTLLNLEIWHRAHRAAAAPG